MHTKVIFSNVIKKVKHEINQFLLLKYSENEIFNDFYKYKGSNTQSDNDYRVLKIFKSIYTEIALNAITLVFVEPLASLIPKESFGNNLADINSSRFFQTILYPV